MSEDGRNGVKTCLPIVDGKSEGRLSKISPTVRLSLCKRWFVTPSVFELECLWNGKIHFRNENALIRHKY